MTVTGYSRHDQIKRSIIKYIMRHKLSRGDQLPAEAELAKRLHVSRNTLREAYVSLIAEGIIIRRHGIGTFVTRVPVVEDSLAIGHVSFPNRIKAAGFTPHFRNLSISELNAPHEVHESLSTPPDAKLLSVERVILADDTPAVYICDYFIPTIGINSCDWSDFSGDMIEFLQSNLNLKLGHIHVKYRAVSVNERIASQLQLPEGLPIISNESVLYTIDNQPVSYSYGYVNPNIFELDAIRIIGKY